MPRQRLFRLIVDDLTASGRFNLRLADGQGRFLAAHEVRADPTGACWRGLFEMDEYLEVQRGRGLTDLELLAELGDFLRTDVLGPEIAARLFRSQAPGFLFVELPRERRPEGVELTRIPWELARDERGRTLPDVGLAVQVLPQGVMPPDVSLDRALAAARPFDPGGPLRVLIAFAQSRGQAALAMRGMRERLTHFFYGELAPSRQVKVDALQYGVTRQALERAARKGGGYHVVHLFAHGHEDLLALEHEDGSDDYVSGAQVAACLSGEFAVPPQLVFLTACHSGEVKLQREIADLWRALRQARETAQGATGQATLDALDQALAADYTGTAFAMLQAEVPQVVAMRYAVEETFAFDLAEQFYRYVLLDGMPPAQALGRFRADARREGDVRGYRPHDWATPAFFGGAEGSQPILLREGRSKDADRLWIHGSLPNELHRADLFVGRTDELRDLRRHLFDERADQAVALLWGVGGLGKTALAVEAVHLWHADLDFTLGVRPPAADRPLSLDAWLQEVNYHVMTSLGERGYRIWDEQGGTDRERWLASRLDELLRFLNTHRLLLVLDNFEPNLRPAGEAGEIRYVCTDPDWGTTLQRLAHDLAPGLSRLLVTSRRAPAELAHAPQVLNLRVGPLPPGEWWVFARTAPNFRRLLLGDADERALLARALAVARGHPLILRALERLAADPADLARRLDEFEKRGGRYAGMGDLLATGRTPEERAQEMEYFEDVAAGSVRALIEECSPAARRLLRVVTLALETVYDGLIEAIWEDEGWDEEMPRLQPAGQGWQSPLAELLDAGLLTPEGKTMTGADGESEETVTYVWHPIVAEQAAAEPPAGPEPAGGFPEADYLRRYAVWNLSHYGRYRKAAQSRAQAELALNAARDAVRYLLRLGDAGAAVALINEIHNLSQALDFRRDLQSWMRELLEQVEPGPGRGKLLVALADVYRREGRPQAAIPLYRQALESAEAREDWAVCGVASHQLGNALGDAADYPAARAAYRAALHYERSRGKTLTGRLPELGELVRLLVIGGGGENLARARAHAVRLAAIARAYYARCQADPSAVEEGAVAAPVDLLIPALDVLDEVAQAECDWETCVQIRGEQIELKREHHKDELSIASAIFNRAVALENRGRLDEAERDLSFCLRIEQEHQRPTGVARILGELASVADERGDPARAAQFGAQALDICHRLGDLSDAAGLHNNLSVYLRKQGHIHEAIQEAACAALIYAAIGEQQNLHTSLGVLSRALSQLTSTDRHARWPTAVALFAAHPLLGEVLAARGVRVEQAQGLLDQLWEAVAGE